MTFWEKFDAWCPRIIVIALVLGVVWLVFPFPKTFQASIHMPPQPAPVVKIVPVQGLATDAVDQPDSRAATPSTPSPSLWPPLSLAIVFGATAAAIVAVRSFRPTAAGPGSAPAAAAAASVTVLGVVTAGLLQFEEKLGDQSYIVAILVGCLTIAPLVGRQFKDWRIRAVVIGTLLCLMIGGFAWVFSLSYPLGPEDPVSKQPTIVSGWQWLMADLGKMTPGLRASLVILGVVFLTNLALAFLKPKAN